MKHRLRKIGALAAGLAALCAMPSVGFAASRADSESSNTHMQELTDRQQRQLLRTGGLYAADWYGYVIKGTDGFLGNHGTVRGAKAYCVQSGMEFSPNFSSYSKIVSDDGYIAAQAISEHGQNNKDVQASVQYLVHQHLEQKPSLWAAHKGVADRQMPQVSKNAAAWWNSSKAATVTKVALSVEDDKHVAIGRQSFVTIRMTSPTGAVIPNGKHTWDLTSSGNIKLSKTHGTAGSEKVAFTLTAGNSGWVKATVGRPQGWFANTPKQTLFYVSGNGGLTATANVSNHSERGEVIKEVDEGVAADSMPSTTTLRATTGVGTTAFSMWDIIRAPVETRLTGLKVIDASDHQKDVTDQFEFSTKPVQPEKLLQPGEPLQTEKSTQSSTLAQTSNDVAIEVKAVWKPSAAMPALPNNHTLIWTFAVTAATQEKGCVRDQAWAQWNGVTTKTEEKKYCLWQPRPNKAWISKDSTGKWRFTTDPGWTNAVGADQQFFGDHQAVAAVVNGIVPQGLIDAPDSIVLSDDYQQAKWLWSPDDSSRIRVYARDIGSGTSTDSHSGADAGSNGDLVESDIGEDVTEHFAITHKGTVVSAAADEEFRASLKKMTTAKRITLLIPGETSVAYGKGWKEAYANYALRSTEALSTCERPRSDIHTGRGGGRFTNAGSQAINGQAYPTNEPNICVRHSPDPPASSVRSPKSLPQTGADAAAALAIGAIAAFCGVGIVVAARRRR